MVSFGFCFRMSRMVLTIHLVSSDILQKKRTSGFRPTNRPEPTIDFFQGSVGMNFITELAAAIMASELL